MSVILRWRRSTRGSALVETAVTLPLIVLLLLATLDFGRLFRTAMAVSHAVRAGAQFGSYKAANSSNTSGMQAAATAAAADITGFTTTAARSCACWNGTSESANPGCTQSTCGSNTMRIYVTVTGSATFSTLVGYPGIPSSVPVSRTAKMRAQ